jgi:ubiquinone/menaquinone biosynthesis C-methylase UbiE
MEPPTPDAAQRARDRFLERIAIYKSFGYDRPAAVRFVVDHLQPVEDEILDVGTGQGVLATELARRGATVVSVDVSEEEQRAGAVNAEFEGLRPRITFRILDAQKLPFPDGSFVAVGTLNALHHFDDGPAAFREMHRVVKPSGKILLAELTDDGFALVARVHESEGRVHPVASITMSLAVEWFLSNGFRLIVAEEGYLQSVAVLEKTD